MLAPPIRIRRYRQLIQRTRLHIPNQEARKPFASECIIPRLQFPFRNLLTIDFRIGLVVQDTLRTQESNQTRFVAATTGDVVSIQVSV